MCVFEIALVSLVGIGTYEKILRPTQNPTLAGMDPLTKSSTEAELIGADNAMPHMLWTRYFLEAQGYGIDENILYQDNMSAILLEKNGKKSSTKTQNVLTCAITS